MTRGAKAHGSASTRHRKEAAARGAMRLPLVVGVLAISLGVGLTAQAGASTRAGVSVEQRAASAEIREPAKALHGKQARQVRSYRTTTTIRYGPFTVPGSTVSEPGRLENVIVREGGCVTQALPCIDRPMPKPCEDCYVTRIAPNLIDADTGETLNFHNGGMLHHVVNVNWSRPDVTCPPGRGPGVINWLGLLEDGNDRFSAAGNERTITRLPRAFGIPIRPEDEWGLIFDVMNMAPQARDVAFEYTFTWTEKRLRPLTAVWLDIDNCGNSAI